VFAAGGPSCGPRLVASFVFFSLARAVIFLSCLPNGTQLFHATQRGVPGTMPYFLPIEVAFKWSISDTGVLEAGGSAQFLSGNQRDAIF
jgi:hypothetical protein